MLCNYVCVSPDYVCVMSFSYHHSFHALTQVAPLCSNCAIWTIQARFDTEGKE
jgi:hypothetical protein